MARGGGDQRTAGPDPRRLLSFASPLPRPQSQEGVLLVELPEQGPLDILSDAKTHGFDTLVHLSAIGADVILQSASLIEPNSPTRKRYCGYVGIQEGSDGGLGFVGFCTYGPGHNPDAQVSVVYPKGLSRRVAAGVSLDAALRAVNKQLDTKLHPSGSKRPYVPEGGGPLVFTRSDFEESFKRLCNRDYR